MIPYIYNFRPCEYCGFPVPGDAVPPAHRECLEVQPFTLEEWHLLRLAVRLLYGVEGVHAVIYSSLTEKDLDVLLAKIERQLKEEKIG